MKYPHHRNGDYICMAMTDVWWWNLYYTPWSIAYVCIITPRTHLAGIHTVGMCSYYISMLFVNVWMNYHVVAMTELLLVFISVISACSTALLSSTTTNVVMDQCMCTWGTWQVSEVLTLFSSTLTLMASRKCKKTVQPTISNVTLWLWEHCWHWTFMQVLDWNWVCAQPVMHGTSHTHSTCSSSTPPTNTPPSYDAKNHS